MTAAVTLLASGLMKAAPAVFALLLPLVCSSCGLVQMPARMVSHVLAPLAENDAPLPGDEPMEMEAMIALSHQVSGSAGPGPER